VHIVSDTFHGVPAGKDKLLNVMSAWINRNHLGDVPTGHVNADAPFAVTVALGVYPLPVCTSIVSVRDRPGLTHSSNVKLVEEVP